MKARISKFSSLADRPAELKDGYWVEILMHESIKVGEPIRGLRTNRNGVGALGWFQTSPVQESSELTPGVWLVLTENSVYHVEEIK